MKRLNIYTQDKKSYAVILFILIAVCDLLAAITGFGGATFLAFAFNSDMMFSTYESLAVSVCIICFSLLTINYAYRNSHTEKLKALGYVNLIMSLLPFMVNSVYYPFAYLIAIAVGKLTDTYEIFAYYDLSFWLSEFVSVPICVYCFVLLHKLKKRGEGKTVSKIPFRNACVITVALFVLGSVTGWFICNNPYSEYFNCSVIEDKLQVAYKTVKEDKILDEITGDTDFSKAQTLLKEEGFVPHTEIKEHITNENSLESELRRLEELAVDEDAIVFTLAYNGDVSYYNKCIVISSDENGKVKTKKLIGESGMIYSDNVKNDIERAKEAFERIVVGDACQSVLKQIKKVAEVCSYCVLYNDNSVEETYEFVAFEDMGFLSLVENTVFNATVVFENGVVKDGKYTCITESNQDSSDTGDVTYKEYEYIISK